jgi:phenylalanyl-tRNA synthetase alpha chain
MSESIFKLKQDFEAELASLVLTSKEEVDAIRVKYLGKKGLVTDLLKQMGALPAEERPAYGKKVNELKEFVSESIENALLVAAEAALQKKTSEWIC